MFWRRLFLRSWEIITKNELMAVGGQVTFYMLLSFFPLLIFILTLAGYVHVNNHELLENLKYLLPKVTYTMVEKIIDEVLLARSPALLPLGILGTFWASLNGMNALMRGIVKAYGLQEKRSIFKIYLNALLFLLIITLAIFLSFTVLVIGEKLGISLFNLFGEDSLFPYLWQKLRLIIQLIFLIVTFMILNRMTTGSHYSFLTFFPGSLFSAVGWVIISLAFSYYVNNFNNYSLTYGSIGGVMILLLWMYWSCEILLLGCTLNAALIKVRE